MEFLTIHELSRQFDTPARVIRYRFHKLRQAGKLTEVQDYRRDDLVDDQHFEWKINPVSFMRAAGMSLAATGPASALGNSPATKSDPLVAKVDNQPPPPVTQTSRPVTNASEPVAKTVTNDLEREMITLLKEQVKVKDSQISDLTVRVREVSETNVKLIGQTLQQSQRIQDLLRLTGGKMDFSEAGNKDGQPKARDGSQVDNQPGDVVDQAPAAVTREAVDAPAPAAKAA
jgi:TolA-binding protein